MKNIKLKTILTKLLAHGNEKEEEIAMELLWQLCFDKNVAIKVLKKE